MSAGAPREAVVEVRGLRSQFGPQVVHDNLDLDVYRGEILGVVGGSGSGKSVLLRTILGLRHPDAGTVRLFGEDLDALPPGRRIEAERRCGVLFQKGALFSSLTVGENIRVPLLEHTRLSLANAIRVAALKISLADLAPEVRHKYPSELSGGMVKRVALARALSLEPELLVLDEPTAGLDPDLADNFVQLIRALQRQLGFTVVMVTHDLDTLAGLATRVAVLAERRIIADCSPAEVLNVDHPFVRSFFCSEHARAVMRGE